MINKEFLMIPGPTPIPPRVMAKMSQPMVNHRGPLFKELFVEASELLKKMLHCSGYVFMFPSSGTGAMELAVQNFTKRGDKTIVVDTGFFGERFYKINKAYGRNAVRLEIPWGRAVEPDEIVEKILSEKDTKAIFITHNETSSTIINNLKKITSEIKKVSDAFIIVDAVSSIGIAPIDMDNWGIDVVAAASQKGLMSPPGIGIAAVNERALDFALSKELDGLYFSIPDLKKNYDLEQPFTTFPVPVLFGLREALDMLYEEGLENVYKRHETYRLLIRGSLKELNLNFVASDLHASPCVTGVYSPNGIDANEIVKRARDKYNVEIAATQGRLNGKAFRIGHMGFVNSNDLLVTISAIECALKDLGYEFELGKSVKKFLDLRREYEI
jgi:aspartate aminotransferase-like enzyme